MSEQGGETDWIFDAIVNYLKSPKWRTPMLSFIEENCLVFDLDEVNKFEYTKIHEASFAVSPDRTTSNSSRSSLPR